MIGIFVGRGVNSIVHLEHINYILTIFLLFNVDFQKVLADFCSLKSFLYTVLSIATAKDVRQIAHSVKSLLPL